MQNTSTGDGGDQAHERRLHPFLAWCLVMLMTVAALAAYQRQALLSELEVESATLHRLASQRADQHDAHMTALSAIAVASEGGNFDLFRDVAATIMRFYPRIDDVELVPLDPRGVTVGTAPLDPAMTDAVRAAAARAGGRIVLLPYPGRAGRYAMVKRSPNTDAAVYGLMLGIDAGKLVEDADAFWSRPGVTLSLSMPDGTPLFGPAAEPAGAIVSKALGSASQPLLLSTGLAIGPADLLPLPQLVLAALAVNGLFFAGLALLRQRTRTRLALEQARLSAMESRLTHASRVNALGEMASGLAHELTQPLTAILAQVQAGRRLLQAGNEAALQQVLDDTVAQGRRAAAILERLRNWSRPQRAPATLFDLRDAVTNVHALLAREAEARRVAMEFHAPDVPVLIAADPVEMEQVVFNLTRNALEALGDAEGEGRVSATLSADTAKATLDIADNGPGIADELKSRLFMPFVTTRPDGTGLGLMLSQRLVERAGGELSLYPAEKGALFRVVLPRADASPEGKR